jgi:hypothetical protein
LNSSETQLEVERLGKDFIATGRQRILLHIVCSVRSNGENSVFATEWVVDNPERRANRYAADLLETITTSIGK